MRKQAGGRLRQLRHSRFNSSRGAIQPPKSFRQMRFPTSDFPVRKKDSASAVPWSASPKDAATLTPDSTYYLSSERWRNRRFQCFFVGSVLLLQCLVIALTRAFCGRVLYRWSTIRKLNRKLD